MNLLPKSHQEFSQEEYWNTFFVKRGTKAFEWYGEYPELSGHLHKYIKQQNDILIIGCGNSTLGRDLYDIGYKKISNIDISQVVIRQMLSQNEKDRPNLKYLQMDALEMSFDDESFNVVLDKGTLDALMPDDKPETLVKIEKYFTGIQKVLKFTGRYICVSLLQEHILKALLDFFPSNNWMFRVVRCFEAENKAVENSENSMPVFLVICTKFKTLPQKILEVNLSTNDKMQRFQSIDEVTVQIKNAQNAAFISSSIKKSAVPENEVSLDLYKEGDSTPRFTVYVVDIKHESKNAQYAAFIVPQGREAEWLFSTKSGRQHLAKVTKTSRLAIVTMHRGQIYGKFDCVQTELNDVICSLAPAKLKNKKIPYLSLGADVGKRIIKYEGSSEFSGPYVIEDVEVDNQKYRRLYFLNNQLVIQSEARLKTVKTKRGIKEVVDLIRLTCRHHVYMSVATHLAARKKETNNIFVIGLGGGGLCSFLLKFLNKLQITAVDIDSEMLKVATDWYGLVQNERLKVVIQDGVDFLKKSASAGKQLNAVLFDIDSKDSNIGMSCPPKQFLEDEVLTAVSRIIGSTGFLIVNLVLRDTSLKTSIAENLKQKYKTVISYKLAVDLNEILICSTEKLNFEEIKKHLRESLREINIFFKKNHLDEDSIEIDEFLNTLKIL